MGPDSIYASLGQAIARHRARLRMTQQNLADAVGISRASVANIERGEQRVYVDQVLSFVDAFGLAGFDELVAGAEYEKSSGSSVSLSGDKLKRTQRRQVRDVLERHLGAV